MTIKVTSLPNSLRKFNIMLQHYFGILAMVIFSKLHESLGQCHASTYSVYGHHLSGHVISTRIVSSLSECVMKCSDEISCKSVNFCMWEKSCDLNDADRHTHPEDYGPKKGSVYIHTSRKNFKSCAEIRQETPQAESGYYWVKIGNRDAQVYCDMKNYGGGWNLVASISSKNNDHLQRQANNCSNAIMCVPFTEQNIIARKLSDEDIHQLAQTEGTFRVDTWNTGNKYTVFHQIPSGPANFDSSCGSGSCPRIIISYSHPYPWETNSCTSIDVGYHIWGGCHRVFDGHDDRECGNSAWKSSQFYGRRVLYGYPCGSLGIYKDKDGMLYVK